MRTLQSELEIKWISHAPEKEIDSKGTNAHKKKKEQLTKRELDELMGVHRPRYAKRGGAFRQK